MTMRIDIICLFPRILMPFLEEGVIGRAVKNQNAHIVLHDLFDDALPSGRHKRQVDDYPYGGGAGMILRPEPIAAVIDRLQSERTYDEIIYLTADGQTFTQSIANELSLHQNLILLCGRYKGIDQRIRDIYVTRELSIGDYVISGGELAAAVVVDTIVRLLPGVLGNESAALMDSFQDALLDPPWYTRPVEFRGHRVPDILLCGDHKAIEQWRFQQAMEKTRKRRPDLWEKWQTTTKGFHQKSLNPNHHA